MDTCLKKRFTVKLKSPNQLFEQWLTDWRDKAIESNSKMQHCFGKALQSLRRYPLPLESGKDCNILQGFGTKLCQMLDNKLEEHIRQNPAWRPTTTIEVNKESPKKKRAQKAVKDPVEYVPTYRSGPYAILIALYTRSLTHNYPGYLYKVDVIKYAKHLCDKSFVKPDPGCFYTAWSSMRILLEKRLVIKKSCPAKFSLTNEGCVLAEKLHKNHVEVTDDDKEFDTFLNNHTAGSSRNLQTCSDNSKMCSQQKSKNNDHEIELPTSLACADETFIFNPYSFDIILLVDKQETVGAIRNPFDGALVELEGHNIMYELRHLKVGDYTWICRHRETNKELVLPYIVERKRMDDLGMSIKDGRFHEQKFRLKQCGLQNLIYLIESHGRNTHTGLPLNTLYQAATNTLLQDGFSVKFTNDTRGTINYFVALTTILKRNYENKTLISCPKQNLSKICISDDIVSLMTFQEFNKDSCKNRNLKIQELFIRQLLQLKGLSVDKALAIVDKFPTPRILQTAYDNYEEAEKDMLSMLQFGKLRKKIGPVISSAICHLYRNVKF